MNANGAPPGKTGLEVNWRALVGAVVVLAFGLALVAVHQVLGAPTWSDTWRALSGGADEPPAEPSLPREIAGEAIETARVRLGAATAFELAQGDSPVYAFVFDQGPHNYTVAFYRRRAVTGPFERYGDVFWPTGFDAPALGGVPPVLGMRERHLGVPFAFALGEQEVSFAPVAPYTWRRLDAGF